MEVKPLASAPVSETTLNEVFAGSLGKKPGDADRDNQDYRIRLPVFEGPLDLLLHLIRRDQINIYDIPVAKICESYLNSLNLMAEPDCNVAGEFFVMAATLLHLKSQVLLPRDEQAADDTDPRLPLVAQLLEYERFKKAAVQIDEREWLDRELYLRPPSTSSDIPVESLLDAPLEPVDTFQMLVCLKIALDRTERPPMQIEVDSTSLRDKVAQVGELLESVQMLDFKILLPDIPKKPDIIVSFLAILELARLKYLEILQSETFGPIQLCRVHSVKDLNMGLLQQY
jgi:segregation and condensation protein A